MLWERSILRKVRYNSIGLKVVSRNKLLFGSNTIIDYCMIKQYSGDIINNINSIRRSLFEFIKDGIGMKIYKRIAEDIKKYIVSNKAAQGFKLPSIIELSKKYDCSKGSVIKAYDVLIEKHIVYSVPQKGFFVADNLIRNDGNSQGIYDLSTGNPLVSCIPLRDIKDCLNSAVDMYESISLDSGSKGIESVLKIFPELFARSSVYCKSRNIYISQGVLQVLTLLTQMSFPNGNDTILIEEPSYTYYINYLKSSGIKVKTIKRDENGIDLKELERIFKNDKIKFFYVIPRNHNPLGTYLSLNMRKSIMKLAQKYDVYIVEDDYFSDLCEIPHYLPLYYYSEFNNCIYLKSYSKTIPYIRIGAAVIPDSLIDMYEEWMEYSYYHSYNMPSLVSQATFESCIKSGIYDKNVNIINKNMKKILRVFNKVTSEWDTGLVKVIGGISGYYSTLVLDENINIQKLIDNLKKRNVLVSSNINCYYNAYEYDNSIRLSFARINMDSLKEALSIIYDEILIQHKNTVI